MTIRPERSIHSCALHRGDFVAFCKFLTGEWICDLEKGEIYSTILKRPIKFTKGKYGYYHARTTHMGRRYDILKHRAVLIAGRGLFNLPEDYFMEVDHINGDKSDNRFKNLRLITSSENTMAYHQSKFDYETAERIRADFAEDDVTKTALAEKYKCSPNTIRRIVNGETYKKESEL